MLAQQEISHWHFGEGLGLDFSEGDPIVEPSSSNAGLAQCPTTICNALGELLLYCDGTNVYNVNGDVIDNGTFDTPSSENLLVGDPGDENQFYLFRSFAGEVNYSIINLTLDGGNGGIAPEVKDIAFHDQESELVSAVNESGSIVWIITADNDPGTSDDIVHLNIYALTSVGLELSGEVDEYYFFSGWTPALDDARISPDCSRIAISFKGHYVCLMRFNNSTGDIYDILADQIDTQASFANITEIEFSPNSVLLYALGDYNTIRQYDLTSWNINEISLTVQIVEQGDINTNWTDLKLGINGKIYLSDAASNELDVINQPDLPGMAAGFENGVISTPEGITTYFPNTPNVICLEPFVNTYIQNENECEGDSTFFSFVSTHEPDSVEWDFGDPDTGDDNFSTDESTFHMFSAAGTYTVELTFFLGDDILIFQNDVMIHEQPIVDLGDDIELGEGNSTILSSGYPDMDNLWSNGDTGESIVVASAGEYWVTVNNFGCTDSDTVNVDIVTSIPGAETVDVKLSTLGSGHYQVMSNAALDIKVYDDLGRLVLNQSRPQLDLSAFIAKRVHLVVLQGVEEHKFSLVVQ